MSIKIQIKNPVISAYLVLIILLLSAIDTSAQNKELLFKKAVDVQQKWSSFAPNKNVVTLVDFSIPMEKDRLFVCDIKSKTILFQCKVAHGVGSGKTAVPTRFSNDFESHTSSLGCYLTLNTYYGYYGKSLRLEGLEKAKNGNAFERKIVVHSSKLMTTPYSWGCFSLPDKVTLKLIETIKGGSLIYAYK